ncbi:S-adenosyl-L-methionine-dependent methyltransferase [Apiospora phragmitis]|uniref:S-adenosyl-L-methionine-dependent methyltransferase n=1 Tax=Apiospora phragmitis TaxID=2905665 RepID=A0ABR1WT67_9PEZI
MDEQGPRPPGNIVAGHADPQSSHSAAELPPANMLSPFQIHPVETLSDLEVDSGRSDSDSAIGSEISSMSTSISTSDYQFRFEDGRRYQSSNDKYHLPNDIREIDRLELQHLLWMELLGGRLHLAPLQKIHMTHALDVGCGTGNWTIEFASQNPQVQVIGTDLSPIQPEYVPVNCTFYIDDATKDWSFHQRFDYIHVRMLTFGITNWDKFIDQAYQYLQPGGFLELQEWNVPLESPDASLKEHHALHRWTEVMNRACTKIGIDIRSAGEHADRMRSRGFDHVGERQKRIGWMGRRDLEDGIDGMSSKLFKLLGNWGSDKEIADFLAEVKADINNPHIHAIVPL